MRCLPLLVTGLILGAGPALAGPGAQGRWITASGNLEVEVAPCGAALCGSVARVFSNHAMQATSKAPPAPPALGMRILTDVRPEGPGRWKGRLFNRENGKTYDCLLSLDGDALTVRAYIGVPQIGQTQVWRRVPG